MTHHHQSGLRRLIDELLQAGQDADRGQAMRRLLEAALQDLVDLEATARIGTRPMLRYRRFMNVTAGQRVAVTRPVIIQGGMGIAVSGWRLAREVAKSGQLGVVSGTALDSIVARRLQDGDKGDHIRRALRHFPSPAMLSLIHI